MLDHRLEREAARKAAADLEAAEREQRRARFGKSSATAELFDMVLNAEALSASRWRS